MPVLRLIEAHTLAAERLHGEDTTVAPRDPSGTQRAVGDRSPRLAERRDGQDLAQPRPRPHRRPSRQPARRAPALALETEIVEGRAGFAWHASMQSGPHPELIEPPLGRHITQDGVPLTPTSFASRRSQVGRWKSSMRAERQSFGTTSSLPIGKPMLPFEKHLPKRVSKPSWTNDGKSQSALIQPSAMLTGCMRSRSRTYRPLWRNCAFAGFMVMCPLLSFRDRDSTLPRSAARHPLPAGLPANFRQIASTKPRGVHLTFSTSPRKSRPHSRRALSVTIRCCVAVNVSRSRR